MKAKPTYEELEKRIQILEENEKRHKEAEQIAQVGYWELDIAYNKLIWSDEIYRIFGLKPQEFKATYEAFLENIHPEDRDIVNEAYTNSLKTKENYEIEHRLLLKNGELKFVVERCNTECDKQGNPIRLTGTVLDITERKHMEDALHETKDKYTNLYKNTPAMLHSIDSQGCLLSVSNYWLSVMGYEEHEVIGKKSAAFLTESSKKYANEVILPDFFKNGYCNEVPYQFIKKSGEIIDVLLSAISEKDDLGKVLHSQAVIVDITQRKKAELELKKQNEELKASEEEIRATNEELIATTDELIISNKELIKAKEKTEESEARFLAFMKNAPFFAYIKDQNLNFVYSNENTLSLVEDKEKNNIRTSDIFNKEITKKLESVDRKILSNQSDCEVLEYSAMMNGVQVCLHDIKFPIFVSGKKTFVAGVAIDITEKKQTEIALIKAKEKAEESENKFRELFEKSGDAILIIENGIFIDCNQAAVNQLEYKSKEDILNNPPAKLSPILQADGKKSVDKEEVMMKIALQKGMHRFEWMHTKSTGKTFPVEVLLTTILNNEKKKIIHVVWRDITVRKIAEKALVESEAKFRSLMEQSPMGIQILTPEGYINSVNPAYLTLFGVDQGIMQEVYQKYRITQDEQLKKLGLMPLIKKAFAGEAVTLPPFEYDVPDTLSTLNFSKTEGGKPWIQGRIYPVKNKKNEIINVVLITEDVTNRKIAEQALTESESRFRTIVENISDGLVILDNEGEFLSVNSAYCKMHGYSLQEILSLKVSDLLHEDNSKSFENYNEFIIKNGFWDEEVIASHKDGSKVFIHIKASVFNYNQDRAILVIVSDISERKKMEQRIYTTMIKAEEQERERYARELHDGLGPLLSTCKIYFHTLKSIDVETQREEHIKRTGELLDEALSSIKEISNNLSPDILRRYGLSQAIKSFTNKLINITKTDYILHSNIKERLPETIEFTIYRTLVELINNSVKHADASEIKINLEGNSEELKILFSDNGKGFDYEIAKKENKGFGLLNLKNRIIKIGGTYHYSSSAGKGMQVDITLKFKQL